MAETAQHGGIPNGQSLAGDNQAGGKRARFWLHPTAWATLVVLGVLVLASSLAVLKVIHNQERLILRERTGEATAVVDSLFNGFQDSLRVLGAVDASGHGQGTVVTSAARSVLTSPGQQVFITTVRGHATVVTASVGGHLPAGQPVPPGYLAMARRAGATQGLVSGIQHSGGARWLVFALGRAAGPGTVVWEEVPLPPHTTIKESAASPFGNLDIALYLSPKPTRSSLLVATTTQLPMAGVQYRFKVGADTWLLVAASPSPLVGALAQDLPWIILGVGLAIMVLLTTVVETLSRRRAYADAAVERGTASLRQAMTDLEAAQAMLVRQERLAAVGQLAASVGHELRNPLGVIMNVLYLLEARVGAEEDNPMRRHLATAKRETSAAALIVSDLLDYSASREPILAPVRVRDLVDEALSVAPPPAGVRVEHRTDAGVTIEADHDQIRQALLNLITNGYDAMSHGGVLTVSATSEPGSAHITVTDTGVGMDEETQANIFTPFFTNKVRGIGLGLAVTKRVVEAHGGSITVSSSPEHGSSFTLTVPTAAALAGVSR